MTPQLTDGRRVDGRLVLALQRCIVESFNEARWSELGYATDTTDIIDSTYRLRRSLSWHDEDYPERVFTAIERIIAEADPPVLDEVVAFVGLRGWLAENDQRLHDHLFGDGAPEAVDELASGESIATLPELMRHARRIRSGLESDPELAIGSAKELLETVMKAVLGDPHSKDDLPALMKRCRVELGLEGTGADSTKRLVGSLSQVVASVAELRNALGTGHGRAGSAEPTAPMARLAVDSAVALSRFLLDGSDSAGEGPPASPTR